MRPAGGLACRLFSCYHMRNKMPNLKSTAFFLLRGRGWGITAATRLLCWVWETYLCLAQHLQVPISTTVCNISFPITDAQVLEAVSKGYSLQLLQEHPRVVLVVLMTHLHLHHLHTASPLAISEWFWIPS